MKVYLILGIIIAVLIFTLVTTIKEMIEQKKTNKKLQQDLKSQQENLLILYRHTEEIAKIKADKDKTDAKIQGAKSDEEILDIINSVLAFNNGMCNNSN